MDCRGPPAAALLLRRQCSSGSPALRWSVPAAPLGPAPPWLGERGPASVGPPAAGGGAWPSWSLELGTVSAWLSALGPCSCLLGLPPPRPPCPPRLWAPAPPCWRSPHMDRGLVWARPLACRGEILRGRKCGSPWRRLTTGHLVFRAPGKLTGTECQQPQVLCWARGPGASLARPPTA